MSTAGRNDDADPLLLPRRLIGFGFVVVAFLASGLLVAAVDAVRHIDNASVDAELVRAQRALGFLMADGVLEPDEVGALAGDFSLAGARLALDHAVLEKEAAIPVPGMSSAGVPVVLAWMPRRFGSETFARLAPRRIAGIVLITAITGGIFYWLSCIAGDLDRRRREMRDLASRDALTGLANRLHFDEALRGEFEHGGPARPFALLYLDLDGFKGVNDTMGHAAGDALLRSIGNRLRTIAGPQDLIARLGGDEFAIIRRSELESSELAAFARTALIELCSAHDIGEAEISVGVSIGVAMAPHHARSAEELMLRADVALYEAKAKPGPTFVFASPERLSEPGALKGGKAAA